MATYTDAFGRVITGLAGIKTDTAGIRSDLQQALLRDVGPKKPYNKQSTVSEEEQNQKKIADALKKLVDAKIADEMDNLTKAVKDLKKTYDSVLKKREEVKKQPSPQPKRARTDIGGMTVEKMGAVLKKSLKEALNEKADTTRPITSAAKSKPGTTAKSPEGKIVDAINGEYKHLSGELADLCRCICACFSKSSVVSRKYQERASKSGEKAVAESRSARRDTAIGSKRLESLLKFKPEKYSMYAMAPSAKDRERKQKSDDIYKSTIQGIRGTGPALANGLIAAMKAEDPVGPVIKALADKFSSFSGSAVNSIIATPLKALGEIEIAGFKLGFLGPLGDALGAFFGAFTEGMLKLVLEPLAEEVAYFDKTLQAEFITKGGAGAGASVALGGVGGKPPEGAGAEWSDIAKAVADYNAGLDGGQKRLEKWRVSVLDVAETGQKTSVIQQAQLKNIQKGITEQDKLRKITRTGLATANQIGASAASTNELFADWSLHLGLSNIQVGQMGRALNNVAKTTGVFGDELIAIAKSSGQFLENMRLAGNFTTQAANNIINLLANASKTGTSKGMQNLLNILSQSSISDNSPLAQLVKVGTGGRADLVGKVLGGTLTDSKESLRDFAANLEQVGRQFTRARPGQSFADALAKMTPELRGLISAQFKEVYGIQLNELSLLLGNIKDSTKFFGETITDLNKKSVGALSNQELQAKLQAQGADWLKKYNDQLQKAGGDVSVALQELLKMQDLPMELRKELTGQISLQQAKSQADHLYLDTGNKLLGELAEGLKKGQTLDQAFRGATAPGAAGGRDYRDFLGAIKKGGGAGVQDVLADQVKRINEQAKNAGLENLKIDPEDVGKAIAQAQKGGEGAGAGIENIINRIQQYQNIVQRKQAEANNPVLAIQGGVDRIEAILRDQVAGKIAEVAPLINGIIKNLNNQPFVQALFRGDFPKAIEEFGKFLQQFADGARDVFAQLNLLRGGKLATDLQTSISAVFAAGATILEPLLKPIGEFLEKQVAVFLKMIGDWINTQFPNWDKVFADFKDVLANLKTLSDLLVGPVGLALAIGGVITVLAGTAGAIALVGSLAGALAGPAGLVVALTAAVGAVGLLVQANMDLDSQIKKSKNIDVQHEHVGEKSAERTGLKAFEDPKKFDAAIKENERGLRDIAKHEEELAKKIKQNEDTLWWWGPLATGALGGSAGEDQLLLEQEKSGLEATKKMRENNLQKLQEGRKKAMMQPGVQSFVSSLEESDWAGYKRLGLNTPEQSIDFLNYLKKSLPNLKGDIGTKDFYSSLREVDPKSLNDALEGYAKDHDLNKDVLNTLEKQLQTQATLKAGADASVISAKAQTTPGSIYVHDTHLEALLKQIFGIATSPVADTQTDYLKQVTDFFKPAMDTVDTVVSQMPTVNDIGNQVGEFFKPVTDLFNRTMTGDMNDVAKQLPDIGKNLNDFINKLTPTVDDIGPEPDISFLKPGGGLATSNDNLLSPITDNIQSLITPITGALGTIIPNLPGMGTVADEARKQTMIQNATGNGGNMDEIEGSSKATANNTSQMIALLGQIGALLSKKLKRYEATGEFGTDGDEVFLDAVLSTEWPTAQYGDATGIGLRNSDLIG